LNLNFVAQTVSEVAGGFKNGGPIPRLGVTQRVEICTIEFMGYEFLLVFDSNYRARMHRLATVHARDDQQPTNNQPNNQRRHDIAYLNKWLFYWSKVRRLKMQNINLFRADGSI